MYGSFNEEVQQVWDFVRCQRSDGTFYGTAGKCRRGDETGAKETPERKPRKKAAKTASAPKKKVAAKPKAKTKLKPEVKAKTPAKPKTPVAPKLSPKAKKALAGATPEQLEKLSKNPRVTPEQKKVLEEVVKQKREGAYTPKAGDGPKGAKAETKAGVFGENRTFNPDAFRKRIEEVKADPKMNAKTKKDRLEILERQAAQAENNKAFLDRLQKNAPKGTKIEAEENLIVMKSTTKSGDTITTAFGPNLGYGFKVNDTHDAGTVTDRKAQMEIASDVRKQYDAIIQSLPPGAIVKTSAYYRDGKGAGRQRIYERMGFSKATPGDDIFAVKNEDGSISPMPAGNASAAKLREQAMDPKALFFAEAKMDSMGPDEMWRALIFGDE
jgi:hypothetical protein